MTISNFDKRVLIEQIRAIEAERTLTGADESMTAVAGTHTSFDDRLWQRARHLADRNDLQAALDRAVTRSRRVNAVAMLGAVLLGALATAYALTGERTVNIYWLLLVLLGFNCVSMLLWLTGITLNLEGLTRGVFAKLTAWLADYLASKSPSTAAADRAWLACHYSGSVGTWQISKTLHQLWLAYLFAGLGILLLLLMARQYDFVWGTTLLSDTAFVRLTETMSAPLRALGFTTPSVEQVLDTRIGATQTLSAMHRYHWAQFLLGSLLCFGIGPRFLLWCIALVLRTLARRHYTLDLYLPYYIGLRHQLLPLAGHGQIIDADTAPHAAAEVPRISTVSHPLPADAYWVAVELGDGLRWPPASVAAGKDLGRVIDRESLADVQQRLHTSAISTVAVAVDAARPPDRGIQRTIANLVSGSAQAWLVLLQADPSASIASSRLAAWYRLAQTCQVPADHVISLRVDRPDD